MTLKIVKNITLSSEGHGTLFAFSNPSLTGTLEIILFNAHSIKGDFFAYGKLKQGGSGKPQSGLSYQAWGDSVDDISRFTEKNWSKDEDGKTIYHDLSPFPPPYEELTDDWEDVPIPIPPETQFITLYIAPNDRVCIEGNMKEEYVIVDDAGNEISLDPLVLRD